MTAEQLKLLVDLVDAKIKASEASSCEDGGLVESIRVYRLLEELEATLEP